MEINGYQLSRNWFDFCFDNPEKISPTHTAIYFFAIEHCNRLGWKDKFGFPTQMTMDALGIKKHQTYIRYFYDLCDWGFIKLIQKSTNQYSANIISITNAKPKNSKALDKAFINHAAKQTVSIGQSISSIDKQETNKQSTNNKEQYAVPFFGLVLDSWNEWVRYRAEIKKKITPSTAKKQIQFLGGRADSEIIAIINQSIEAGWTGLFELKNKTYVRTKETPRSVDAIIDVKGGFGTEAGF